MNVDNGIPFSDSMSSASSALAYWHDSLRARYVTARKTSDLDSLKLSYRPGDHRIEEGFR